MKPIIETERLYIRELVPEDAAGIFRLDSDPDVHEFLGKKPIKTLEEAQNAIAYIRTQYQTNGIGRWAMVLKDTNEFIGWTGLKLITEPLNQHVQFYDLGYRIIKEHWRKGYGLESATACLNYGFNTMQLDKIYAYAMIGNTGSRAILQKLEPSHTEFFSDDGDECIWFEYTNKKAGN
ncbi:MULTISPECIES: GNAT family N-acetyltransferase [unclassified Flavobacterium]|uniref:GNAT family N-acetyltransferase n=1 Tax=unclassified Flavobacterium TaxID=196869 RepID=UPI0009618C12|nr:MULTISPECIES: GNAT family N-acetyltransferase [unclassified Flavobacterium]MBN9284973.1 GNAT family N-acetyltransferase [Flavobacterium sp.]OJV72278.1 MAG: GNAT family N-acetyltransferase [Flavobacterium sp. 40-81]